MGRLRTLTVILIGIIGILFIVNLNQEQYVYQFRLYREHGINYLGDVVYYRTLQYGENASYYKTSKAFYTYGNVDFLICDLETGDIKVLINKNLNEEAKASITRIYANDKRIKENLDTPYLIVLKNESELSREEKDIMYRLSNKSMEYPRMDIFAKKTK